MAARRILVIDNQTHLTDVVKSALAPYGFDTELIEYRDDSVHKIKTLRPDLVFIRIQGPDKSGLSLCNKAKKVAGSRIPVILITSSIAPSDIELHGKQRYHADLYLKESDLSQQAIIEKTNPLIKLPTNDYPDDAADNHKDQSFSSHNRTSKEKLPLPEDDSDNIVETDSLSDDEPSWLKNLFDEVLESSSDDKSLDSGQQKKSITDLLNDDWDSYNDLEHRLVEQEREIAHLTSQLEEARRGARSSPFSSDYLSLREDSIQKEKEISILKDQLSVRQQQVAASDQRLKELAKRLLSTKAELDQLQSKERAISEQYLASQTELSKLNRSFEESRIHFDSKIEKLTLDHAEKLRQTEHNYLAEIDALKQQIFEAKEQAKADAKKQHENRLSKLNEDNEYRIESLQQEHNQHIKKLENEKESLAESIRTELTNEITSLRKEHQQFIETMRSNHADDLQRLTSRISDLNREHENQLEEAAIQRKAELDHLKQDFENQKNELLKRLQSQHKSETEDLERKHSEKIRLIKNGHTEEIENLKSAMDGAQQCVDTEIEALLSEHDSVLNQMEQEHLKTISILKQQIEEERKNTEAKIQNEIVNEIAKLKKDHKREIATLKKTIEQHEDKIKSARNDFQSELAQKQQEYTDKIENLKKQLKEEKKKVAEQTKDDSRKEIENIRVEQKELIAKLKKDHSEKLNEIKSKYEDIKVKYNSAKEAHEAEILKIKEGRQKIQTEKLSEIKSEKDKLEQKLQSTQEKLQTELANLKEKHQNELQSFDRQYKKSLHELDMQYAGQIAELKEENVAEIQKLKQQIKDDAKRADERLAKEQRDHEETRIKLESRLAEHLVAQSKRTSS